MSDMIINDSVPVDKKWNELIKYNIFIMKLIEFGLALLLCIMPNIVDPVDSFYCLASAPTLMISFHLIVLYVVDQVQPEAEFYYLVIQLFVTTIALLNLIFVGRLIGAIYGLFYVDLIIAFIMDLNYIRKQRGFRY
ncbi:PREDICTED: uncharacterized protein LOC106119012 isoform X3 [Papilio xuthus]|uniref:Uncharacterized protein LOC106119012 isoform X3 n=1 Tax=Papilio xuthus TaxID=66420 RepID=A0AAJ6ZBU0_PAPXU|nr:PREDICTED: uncharacterized protein LOC106119012 isoform X3 [Papilio xuthus]